MLTQAAIDTHDDLLRFGNPGADERVLLDKRDVPTWGKFTGYQYGGNQNTARYAHYKMEGASGLVVDRLPAYRQIVDLGD